MAAQAGLKGSTRLYLPHRMALLISEPRDDTDTGDRDDD